MITLLLAAAGGRNSASDGIGSKDVLPFPPSSSSSSLAKVSSQSNVTSFIGRVRAKSVFAVAERDFATR